MPTATDSGSEPTPNRFRFSLRTIFIVLFVLCVALGYYLTSARMQNAEKELAVLRKEAGHLIVKDRKQFQAVAVDTDKPDTWRWRLFIPQGHQYSWNIACEDIPHNEVPQRAGATGVSNEPY